MIDETNIILNYSNAEYVSRFYILIVSNPWQLDISRYNIDFTQFLFSKKRVINKYLKITFLKRLYI